MSSRRARILVVEDDASLRKVMELRLSLEGYEVVVAADGQAGVEAMDAQSPDIVITDLMMPRLDGYGLCRLTRGRTDALRDLPIILLTAHQHDAAVEDILGLGNIVYMNKPFDPPLLKGTLEELLASRTSATV